MTNLRAFAFGLIIVAGALPATAETAAPFTLGTELQLAATTIPELDPAIVARLRPQDFVTSGDLERGPVRFRVPGKGMYELKEIRAPGGAICRMHLPSIARALKASGGTGDGPTWINLSIYTIHGKTHCFWPPNGACYAMALKVAS